MPAPTIPDVPMPDDAALFAAARANMVNGQLTPAKLRDPRIIDAMRHLPRERFVHPAQRAVAYADRDVPMGGGRVLMEPRIIGRLVQILVPLRGERAAVVGAGSGYGAALLAMLGLVVTALEEDAGLLELARAATAELAPAVTFRHGALAAGLADVAPYPVVLVEGAVEVIPPPVADLLAAGGRLATVLHPPGEVGRGVLAERAGAGLRTWPHFDASTAVLPGFRAPRMFRF